MIKAIGMCSIPALEAEQLVVDIVCILGWCFLVFSFKGGLLVDQSNKYQWKIVGSCWVFNGASGISDIGLKFKELILVTCIILRISQLSQMVSGGVTKEQIKWDAWMCKKFCVMIKRKCHRGQAARSWNFQQLLSILSGEDCCNIV